MSQRSTLGPLELAPEIGHSLQRIVLPLDRLAQRLDHQRHPVVRLGPGYLAGLSRQNHLRSPTPIDGAAHMPAFGTLAAATITPLDRPMTWRRGEPNHFNGRLD